MALPGGYVDVAQDVNTEATANRKLKDKTGIEPTYLEQFKAILATSVIRAGSVSRWPILH